MSVIEVNDTNYIREVQNSDLPVLLDFYATWCGPCQMLSPIIHALAEAQAGRFKFCQCNVDQAPGLVQQFRIMSVPTLVVMAEGKVCRRLVGGQDEEDILKALEEAARS